ncbi:hypothetical protein [Streptomyces luteireticuli]|uniref:ATP-binding protein n=1 Tax=Streptomyces luteireticuli TaxID=173858 RepID=A0ABP3IHX4_9ACTN
MVALSNERPAGLIVGTKVHVSGVSNSTVLAAGRDIKLHARQPLVTVRVTDQEIAAVRRAWVKIDRHRRPLVTASEVLTLLREGEPVVVIAGARGVGKTAAAVRALTDYSKFRAAAGQQGTAAPALELEHILPDWESPDAEILPDGTDRGYILDVSEEIDQWEDRLGAAKKILGHGDALKEADSCLIVIASETGWPTSQTPTLGRVVVRATARPPGDLVTLTHLANLYPKMAQRRWLVAGNDELESEALSDLLSRDMYPCDAAVLAHELSEIDDSPDALETARSTVLQWRDVVKDVFARTSQDADDRALLLAAIMLDGATPADVLAAARLLLQEEASKSMREILTGPDLATRLENVHARVTGQNVTFSHKPGYSGAILRYVWRQLSDAQDPLLEWVKELTKANGLGAGHLSEIANLLVRLAVDEHDLTVLDVARAWAVSDHEHGRDAAAAMLAQAAEDDTLGTATRTKLRTWAGQESVNTAKVAAVVCQGTFATTYPRQALTCLRWVLNRSKHDDAVNAAEDALCAMANNVNLLPQVWKAVTSWKEGKWTLARRRGFLALIDPTTARATVYRLLDNALTDAQTADELVDGWCEALGDPLLADRCEQLLERWAQAVSDRIIEDEPVVRILDRVVDDHLMTGPMAAFLIGKAGAAYNSPAVISMRERLMVRRRGGGAGPRHGGVGAV